MDGSVKVPLIGPVKKKTAMYGGGALALVFAGLWLYRRRQLTQGTPASSAAGQQTDPAGNTGTIDPATGYVQGSPQDLQALAAAQTSGAPFDTSQLGAGGLGGYYYGSGGSNQPTPPGPGNFADNAEWAQYATSYLTGTLNEAAGPIGAALGRYIAGDAVGEAQASIINQAIAYAGLPPQPGKNGDPPGIKLVPDHKHKPPPKTGLVDVPKVTDLEVTVAIERLADAHLHYATSHRRAPHQSYRVTRQTPAAGTKVRQNSVVHLTIQAVNPSPLARKQ